MTNAYRGNFDILVTIDANLEYQQKLVGIDFAIVVIHEKSNRFADIEPMKADLNDAAVNTAGGKIAHVRQ